MTRSSNQILTSLDPKIERVFVEQDKMKRKLLR